MRWLVRGAVVVILLAAACSSTGGDEPEGERGAGAPPSACATTDAATVSAGAAVALPEAPPEATVVTDDVVGDGHPVDPAGLATLHWVAVSCATGEVLASTEEHRQPVTVMPGMGMLPVEIDGSLTEMRVGGRRTVVVPAATAGGGAVRQLAGPADTVVYVIELLAASGPDPVTTDPPPVPTDESAGTPCVAAQQPPTAPGEPEVPVPEGPAPTEIDVVDLIEGDGPAWEPGSFVTAHSVLVACTTGEEVSSTWDAGAPSGYSSERLPPGWERGLEGMHVGGRRLLVVPAAEGEGDDGGPGLPPGETAVWVVDLVALG